MSTQINDTKELLDFISKAPSTFHVVDNMRAKLLDNGFIELDEKNVFRLEKGSSYFVTRNNSSLIAFHVPSGDFTGFNIISAHTDSPTFKIKPNPEVKTLSYIKLNVEKYGGMLLSPWFDRPLSVAGRAFVLEDGVIKERLVNIDRPLLSIVNLAIHQNRSANDGIKYSVQKELLPLFSQDGDNKAFIKLICNTLNCSEDNLLDYDLYLYNRSEPTIWGLNNEFFSSARIDDLQCAYCAFKALMDVDRYTNMPLIALFDNEEVGSGTKQGALSDFLQSIIDRISLSLSLDQEEKYIKLSSSFMVSADNAHAAHPSYLEKSDITNLPELNKGVVIKYNANQKYTTDAKSGAFIKSLMKKHDIPYQIFVNNSDQMGGSTLGNLSSQKVSIDSCDIGLAQLAMHSPYECGGTEDTTSLLKLFKVFLSL